MKKMNKKVTAVVLAIATFTAISAYAANCNEDWLDWVMCKAASQCTCKVK